MNLLEVVKLFYAQGAQHVDGIGTDFSVPMVEAAHVEAKKHLPRELSGAVRYFKARNETLSLELASCLGVLAQDLFGTFDIVLGVNTFRHAYRMDKDNDCARDIFNLLRPGGFSIMMDMNRGFQFVGSRMHDLCMQAKRRYYIPTVPEYSRPFERAGFVITQARNFFCFTCLPCGACIPNPIAARLLSWCRRLRPTLDKYLSSFAKHSLVMARKPLIQ